MSTWTELMKQYAFRPDDLPRARPCVAIIAGVDTEKAKDDQGKDYDRPILRLVGWFYPFRLNSTHMAVLKNLYGDDPRACIGKRIALFSTERNIYGTMKSVIDILPEAPSEVSTPHPVPARLAVTSAMAIADARELGVQILSPTDPGSRVFAGASNAPRLTGAAEPQKPVVLSGETLGLVQALRAMQGLYRRNKTIAEAASFVADRAPQMAKEVRGIPMTLWPKEAGQFVTLLINTFSPTRECDAHRVQELENELKQAEADFAADATSLDKLPENDDDIPI